MLPTHSYYSTYALDATRQMAILAFSMREVVLVTGASNGFCALSTGALAEAKYTVYSRMLDPRTTNVSAAAEAVDSSAKHGVDPLTTGLDGMINL